MTSVFHLSIHVADLAAARAFYGGVLGCPEGRSAPSWVDYDFFGHQLSLHLGEAFSTADTGEVGAQMVPMPHFGVVLDRAAFDALAARLRRHGSAFVIEPMVRFAGQTGEQATMFFRDPSGNPIEVKSFADQEGLYAR